jgi:hypothetical protein
VALRVGGCFLECVIPKVGVFQPREGSRAGLIAILRSPAGLSVEATNPQGGRGKPASEKLRARSLDPLVKTRVFGMTPYRGTK